MKNIYKKLTLIIPIILVVGFFSAVAAAKTGHFPLFAKVLSISADADTSIHVTVVDSTGANVQGAELKIGNYPGGTYQQTAKTGADGQYIFDNVATDSLDYAINAGYPSLTECQAAVPLHITVGTFNVATVTLPCRYPVLLPTPTATVKITSTPPAPEISPPPVIPPSPIAGSSPSVKYSCNVVGSKIEGVNGTYEYLAKPNKDDDYILWYKSDKMEDIYRKKGTPENYYIYFNRDIKWAGGTGMWMLSDGNDNIFYAHGEAQKLTVYPRDFSKWDTVYGYADYLSDQNVYVDCEESSLLTPMPLPKVSPTPTSDDFEKFSIIGQVTNQEGDLKENVFVRVDKIFCRQADGRISDKNCYYDTKLIKSYDITKKDKFEINFVLANYVLSGLPTKDRSGQSIVAYQLGFYLEEGDFYSLNPELSTIVETENLEGPTFITQSKYKKLDITLNEDFTNLLIHYRSAVDGKPIDFGKKEIPGSKQLDSSENTNSTFIYKERISYNLLKCLDDQNKVRDCFESKKLDPSDSTNSTFIYKVRESKNYQFTNYLLDFRSEHYLFIGYTLDKAGGFLGDKKELTVYLINTTSQKDKDASFYCENHGGLNVCSYAAAEAKEAVFNSEKRKILDKLGAVIKQLSNSMMISTQSLFILGRDENRAYAKPYNDITSTALNSKFIFFLSVQDIDETRVRTWVHEFGHLVDFAHSLSALGGKNFTNSFEVSKINSCSKYGYRCLSDYGSLNKSEYWAEFFTMWVTDYQSITDMLNNPKVSKECKNALSALLKIMNEHFGSCPHYTYSKHLASAGNFTASASGGVLGATSADKYDPSILNKAMSDLGYSPVSEVQINSAFSLSSRLLTPEQIASGKWRKENYDTMSSGQKALFQANTISNQINFVISQGKISTAVQKQIQKLNQVLSSWLSKIGQSGPCSYTGIVVNNTGAVDGKMGGLKVTIGNGGIGNRSTLTNKDGQFELVNLKEGTNQITVLDPQNNKKILFQQTVTVPKYKNMQPCGSSIIRVKR